MNYSLPEVKYFDIANGNILQDKRDISPQIIQ